jgi:hypothetical protein
VTPEEKNGFQGGQGYTPRVFCVKSAEDLERIGDSVLDSAKECVRV